MLARVLNIISFSFHVALFLAILFHFNLVPRVSPTILYY